MVKETPFAEGSIEWESCAVGECSEIHTGSLWEPCHGLIPDLGLPMGHLLGSNTLPKPYPSFPA